MSHEVPSPEQAADALGEISGWQQRAAVKASKRPEWLWWTAAGGIVLSGLAADLWPSLGPVPGLVVAALALCLVASMRSRRIATTMGYQAAPDLRSMPRKAVSVTRVLVVAALALALIMTVALTAFHVPFRNTIGCVVIAALVVAVVRPMSRSLLDALPERR